MKTKKSDLCSIAPVFLVVPLKPSLSYRETRKALTKLGAIFFDCMGILTRQDVNDPTNPLYQRGDLLKLM